ncbi:MAG: hypothetical protein RL562_2458, partial [Planctomycetota bacterium]
MIPMKMQRSPWLAVTAAALVAASAT